MYGYYLSMNRHPSSSLRPLKKKGLGFGAFGGISVLSPLFWFLVARQEFFLIFHGLTFFPFFLKLEHEFTLVIESNSYHLYWDHFSLFTSSMVDSALHIWKEGRNFEGVGVIDFGILWNTVFCGWKVGSVVGDKWRGKAR